MKTSFISTPALFHAGRTSLLRMQRELASLQGALTSGRHEDQGLALGHQIGRTVSLRNRHNRMATLIDTNGLLAARLDTSQAALGGIQSIAESFMATMVGLRDGTVGADIAVATARSALAELVAFANTTHNGGHIFGGINTGTEPLEDYFATPATAGKLAVDAAFLAEFGIAQNDPAVSAISAGDMQAFLDGAFGALFDAAGWTANFSSASDENLRNRIASGSEVDAGTNANEAGFRELAAALIMVADLGTENLNDNARRTVIDSALVTAGDAIQDIIAVRAEMGLSQERIERTSVSIELQMNIINEQVVSLENVDPYETASQVNQLVSQIEVSYALTARIAQLSLVDRI